MENVELIEALTLELEKAETMTPEQLRTCQLADSWYEVLDRAERLHNLAVSLRDRIPDGVESLGAQELSRRIVRFLRPITRVIYQESGPYHQDPALSVANLPGLASLEAMETLEPDSHLYRFTRNYIVRELNRLKDHLDQALEEGERLAGELTL